MMRTVRRKMGTVLNQHYLNCRRLRLIKERAADSLQKQQGKGITYGKAFQQADKRKPGQKGFY